MKMRRISGGLPLLLLAVLFAAFPLKGQVNIGSIDVPKSFSLLELNTVEYKAGLRLPQLTTQQRDSLSTNVFPLVADSAAAKGLVIFNTDTDCLDFWNGSGWISLCSDATTSPSPNGINLKTAGSDNQTVCSGTAIEDITYTATGATGATVSGLPDGVTETWANNAVTISGTPAATATGTFNYTVTLTGVSGTATGTITVNTVPAQPGAITGSTSVTANATGQTYSVTNVSGVTYNWALPSGWTQTAGGTTNSITVTAGTSGGTITVTPGNSCGNGTPQTLNVTAAPAIVIPTTLGAGSLSGRICFDIAESNDDAECGTLASRLPNQANFADPATNTQTYTFTAASAVTNLRFAIVDPEGALLASDPLSGTLSPSSLASGGTASVTVHFKTTLNRQDATPKIYGRTRDGAAKVTINIIYFDGSQDVDVALTANIQDCMCCGALVTATQWKEFLCYNLGADQTVDPFTPSQGLNGDYYQWGANTPAATVNTPSGAISGWNTTVPSTYYGDNTTNTNTTTKSPTDPCPTGYRVPSYDEWNGVISNNTQTNLGTWSANNWSGSMFGNALFLPAAGSRLNPDGSLNNRGVEGYYWSSRMNASTAAYPMHFTSSSAAMGNVNRPNGISVRCVAQ